MPTLIPKTGQVARGNNLTSKLRSYSGRQSKTLVLQIHGLNSANSPVIQCPLHVMHTIVRNPSKLSVDSHYVCQAHRRPSSHNMWLFRSIHLPPIVHWPTTARTATANCHVFDKRYRPPPSHGRQTSAVICIFVTAEVLMDVQRERQ